MDLFASAGVELAPLRRRLARARPSAPRSLRVPLFAYKVVEEARLQSRVHADGGAARRGDRLCAPRQEGVRKIEGGRGPADLHFFHSGNGAGI